MVLIAYMAEDSDCESISSPWSPASVGSSVSSCRQSKVQGLPGRFMQPEVKTEKRMQKNARERQRVAQVRNQYNALRRALGDDFRTQKVNKVKTLVGAKEYIINLRNELERLRNAKVPSSGSAGSSQPSVEHSPPPLSCDETLDGVGADVRNEDLEFYPKVPPPGDACIPLGSNFFASEPTVSQIQMHNTLPSPLSSPPTSVFEAFSPSMPFASQGGDMPELFQTLPLGPMPDIVYETGHNPWTLSPPSTLCHYAMPYYSS